MVVISRKLDIRSRPWSPVKAFIHGNTSVFTTKPSNGPRMLKL